MKITDTIGRTVDIALVAKPAANARFGADVDWLRPIFHKVTDSSKLFVRMPEGPFAIRVMSKHATQMLVHVSGKLVLRTDVAPGLQYIKKDGSGSNFVFGVNAARCPHRRRADRLPSRLPADVSASDVQPRCWTTSPTVAFSCRCLPIALA
jgi:hypothetical protein